MLVATPAIRNLIREGKTHQIYSMLQAGGRYGMVTMDMSLAQLVRSGQISLDVALERCANEEDLRRLHERLIAMPETFAYKVRDKAGKLRRGHARGRERAARRRASCARWATCPSRSSSRATQSLSRDLKIPFFSDRIKLKDVAVFSRQFATMINSGLSLLRSLNILAEQTESKPLAAIVEPGAPRRREGLVALGRAGEAPEGVQPPLRRDGARR